MNCNPVRSKASQRARHALARFTRNRDGATAVEFALVALPFLFCVFAILELAIVFLISVTLDNATAIAARTIRTGDTRGDGGGSLAGAVFAQKICDNLGWLGSQCTPNTTMFVDVRVLNNWDDTPPPAVVNQQMNTQNFCYYSGDPGKIVLVRSFFKWPLLTPFLNAGLSRLGNGVAVLSSTAAFKNEPFSPKGTTSTC